MATKLQEVGGTLTGAIAWQKEAYSAGRETRAAHLAEKLWRRLRSKSDGCRCCHRISQLAFRQLHRVGSARTGGGVGQGDRRGVVIGCDWSNHGELHRTFFHN
ncbi:hypothetical protein Q5691_08415 [Microcoleus sp. w1-18aA5]|uniref:hypothetical protein n=1 Tax=Microcoleus sp. w1-18aA5 TaxID=2818982 RepID=UPI002FCE6F38